tara:strand:+ start:455 stop:868 length:414 start_codon:yes stop_codon:yes gene_type:complete
MLLVFLVVVVVVKEYREGSHIFSSSSSSSVRFHSSSSSWKNTRKWFRVSVFGFKKKRGKFFSHFFFQKTREKRARVVPKTTDLIHEGSPLFEPRASTRDFRERDVLFFPPSKRARVVFIFKEEEEEETHSFCPREEV